MRERSIVASAARTHTAPATITVTMYRSDAFGLSISMRFRNTPTEFRGLLGNGKTLEAGSLREDVFRVDVAKTSSSQRSRLLYYHYLQGVCLRFSFVKQTGWCSGL